MYDRTKAVDFIYQEFQKAFDKVPYERLVAKVEAHRIQGNYPRWIQNWLIGHTQREMIHDQASDSTLVTSEVPQGTSGLFLFIIYINDLDVGIISKINKFADETKLRHKAVIGRDTKNAEEFYMILIKKIATATEHHIPRKRVMPTKTLLGSHKRLNASSMQDNIRTEDSNDTKQNPIFKNISTPAGLEKRSCLTNLLDFFGEVNRIYNRTKAVDFVYLDFQKAFDKVPHEKLITKVEAHGIRGNYSRWVRNWLTGRTQRVMIHDEISDSTFVTSGVPQGSVLGPLLFIIYIKNLYVGIISKINKFADDTKLCHRAFTDRDRATIHSDLNCLLQWTETW
ncbi:Reverse transcriptase domain [Trinorchestia longiramus]|nr:Reverse transcriptase domain [Trinorchestia longiramus]